MTFGSVRGRKAPRGVGRDAGKRGILIAAVVAFLLVDIGLVAVALNSVAPAPESAATTAPAASAAPSPSPTPSPSVAPAPASVVPARMLEAVDASTAWRATTGACPDALALPELTVDSGATFTATDATGPADIVALQSIVAGSGDVATFVGQSALDCSPLVARTFVAGANYGVFPEGLDGAWYVDAANRAQIHRPGGLVPAPCASVVSLSARDAANAAVLCDDGTIVTTADAAETWSAPVAAPGAMNLAATADGYLVASVAVLGCDGVQVGLLGDAVVPSGCLPVAVEPSALAGNIALSVADDGTLWVWAGDALGRSGDGGASWL